MLGSSSDSLSDAVSSPGRTVVAAEALGSYGPVDHRRVSTESREVVSKCRQAVDRPSQAQLANQELGHTVLFRFVARTGSTTPRTEHPGTVRLEKKKASNGLSVRSVTTRVKMVSVPLPFPDTREMISCHVLPPSRALGRYL